MGDKLDYQAQDISRSVLYGPLPRALDESVQRTIDEERKVLDNAFYAMEQGVGMPAIQKASYASIVVAGLPTDLVITGSGFGTDNTKVSLLLGDAGGGPFVAKAAGFSDTNAEFDISGATGLAAGDTLQVMVLVTESTTKAIRSFPLAMVTA